MYELIPMLSLAGKPTEVQLKKRLKYYCDHGVNAVMLYPRSGCEVEYMSEGWKDICRICIEYAAEHNIQIWLYDEFNWPSGSCKGRVTEGHDEFVSKRFAVVDDTVKVERTKNQFAFYVDLFNEDAVKHFIELTHEKYYEWFGEYFGTVIQGIFTDEPSFVYSAMIVERGLVYSGRGDEYYPYYNGICDDYKAKCGYDIFEDLLDYHKTGYNERFSQTYYRLLGERFSKSYVRTVAKWCEEHNIMLTGHMYGDERITRSILSNGDIFKCLNEMQMPGVDEICTDFGNNDDFIFSHIQQQRAIGKKLCMAELFAFGPCSMPTARERQMLWYAGSYGVNRYFLAISHLDGRGNYTKQGYFNDYSEANPKSAALAELAKAAAEAAEFSNKTPIAYVSVRQPYSECCNGLRSENGELYHSLIVETMRELIENQIPWKMISEDWDSDTEITLSFRNKQIVIEEENKCFNSSQECVLYLSDKITRPVTVTEADGTVAKGLLVRCTTDGSYAVIDRADEIHPQRTLVLHKDNTKTEFVLPCFGVFCGEDKKLKTEPETEIKNVQIKLNNKKFMRSYINEEHEWEFELESKARVEFNKRIYPDAVPVMLDGKELEFNEKSTSLTDCFNELYAKSAEIELEAGTHRIVTEALERPYMPAVIIESEETDENEAMFFGRASVTFEAEIKDNCYIVFDDNMLCCEAVINGEKISCRAFAPYEFEIPHKYAGKNVSCELVFYSSYAPLFGDSEKLKEMWVNNKPSVPDKFLIKNLRIVSEDI